MPSPCDFDSPPHRVGGLREGGWTPAPDNDGDEPSARFWDFCNPRPGRLGQFDDTPHYAEVDWPDVVLGENWRRICRCRAVGRWGDATLVVDPMERDSIATAWGL